MIVSFLLSKLTEIHVAKPNAVMRINPLNLHRRKEMRKRNLIVLRQQLSVILRHASIPVANGSHRLVGLAIDGDDDVELHASVSVHLRFHGVIRELTSIGSQDHIIS